MSARVYPSANPVPTTNEVLNANPNQTEVHSPAQAPEHNAGDTINKVDQLSSVTLLGLAVVGAATVVLIHHLIG